MKAVILAGGFGTRISEESLLKPKPMVEIGDRPILWHIMKIYSYYGINDFIICLGYKGYIIKEYFNNFLLHSSDITLDLVNHSTEFHDKSIEPWKVTLVDTGLNTMTGGRIKRIKKYLNDETFCMTYGDGLADINITKLINQHKKSKLKATLVGVCPPGRYGVIERKEKLVTKFAEKINNKKNLINGGFFVLEPEVLEYISGDSTSWEKEPLEKLTKNNELGVYEHSKFWQSMDTMREKKMLEEMWKKNQAPWKKW